jgi:hypothetical protein
VKSSTVMGRITLVPTMNIKDPEVRQLAVELAALRGTSLTDAVRQALTEALAEGRAARDGIARRILEISDRAARIEAPVLTDDDLYDERGLPRR